MSVDLRPPVHRVAAIALAVLAIAASPSWASSFSITDTTYQVQGQLFTQDDAGNIQTLQSYNESSTSPLFEQIFDPYGIGVMSVATSTAAGSFLSVDVVGRDPLALADANEIVDFVPHFNGSIDGILFYGAAPYTSWSGSAASWTITDLTSGALVSVGTGGRVAFSDPMLYDEWNSTHTYQLIMDVNASVNAGDTPGWMATNLFSVPEPSGVELVGLGLAALTAIEFRRRRHESSRR